MMQRPSAPEQPLSVDGCGRATAYPQENKIVTVGDLVHVAWLDSVAEGFRVRIRTLDRRSGSWSETHTLGEAYDNHGGPALVCDSRGYLHVAYYPHHHAIRYRRSLRPGDASAWTDEELIGSDYTYPKLLVGAGDELLLSCRRSFLTDRRRLGHARPWELHLLRKSAGGAWSEPLVLARSRHPGYTHFGESYAWGPGRRGLHMALRFHEKSDAGAYGRLQTVGYLFSPDAGRTWQRSDGTPVPVPATAESVDVIAAGGVDHGSAVAAGAMAVAADGTPWLIHSEWAGGVGTNTLCSPAGDGSWRRIVLNERVELEPGRCFGLAPSIVFDSGGRLVGVTTTEQVSDAAPWGHPASEVVRFASADGGATFAVEQVSTTDPRTAHWFPHLERPLGIGPPPAAPGIIYTAGPAGETCSDLLSNRVMWAP